MNCGTMLYILAGAQYMELKTRVANGGFHARAIDERPSSALKTMSG